MAVTIRDRVATLSHAYGVRDSAESEHRMAQRKANELKTQYQVACKRVDQAQLALEQAFITDGGE